MKTKCNGKYAQTLRLSDRYFFCEDGDSEECLTCNCLNAGYELRTKEMKHEV